MTATLRSELVVHVWAAESRLRLASSTEPGRGSETAGRGSDISDKTLENLTAQGRMVSPNAVAPSSSKVAQRWAILIL